MTLIASRRSPKPSTALAVEAQLITVWGPQGSTGKSSIALNLAYELTQLGQRVLLLDLDTVSPAISQLLPVGESTAGLAGAARLIRQGRFSPTELDRLSIDLRYKRSRMKFLPGLSSPTRWPEITSDTIQQLINISKINYDFVIADLASNIEANLINAEHSTQRNIATTTALELASQTLVVLAGTQLSLSRYLNNFGSVDQLQKVRRIIVNGSEGNSNLTKALKTLTKESVVAFVPDDAAAFQLAESQQLPLALARRKSPARNSIIALAHKLLEWQP